MTGIAVYSAVNAVSLALSRDGINKTRQSQGGGNFKFRGIDDVMNALAPLLVANKLIIVPRILDRTCDERTVRSGTVMYYVTVAAEFDFISAEDGSKFTARTYGEAMDSGDKATNKAMAIAYKYAAFQTFCIPTEGSGDTDPDATVHEPTIAKPSLSQPKQTEKPAERVSAPAEKIAPKTEGRVSPPSTRAPIATVQPSKPVESWKDKERAQISKGAADALLEALEKISEGLGISKPEILENQFEGWKGRCKQSWRIINDADKDRIGVEVEKFKAALEREVTGAETVDPETGEIREAAE